MTLGLDVWTPPCCALGGGIILNLCNLEFLVCYSRRDTALLLWQTCSIAHLQCRLFLLDIVVHLHCVLPPPPPDLLCGYRGPLLVSAGICVHSRACSGATLGVTSNRAAYVGHDRCVHPLPH